MSNYRIIKHDNEKLNYFTIHEVFQGNNGKIQTELKTQIDIIGKRNADIKNILKQAVIYITVLEYRGAFEEEYAWRLWTHNDHSHFAE